MATGRSPGRRVESQFVTSARRARMLEIRISKSETNSKHEIRMTETLTLKSVLNFRHSDFGFVSDFAPVELEKGRASDLVAALPR